MSYLLQSSVLMGIFKTQAEEMELWIPHESLPPDSRGHGYPPSAEMRCSITGRVLSSFNASATLCKYLRLRTQRHS
jgi:hypothetical protein